MIPSPRRESWDRVVREVAQPRHGAAPCDAGLVSPRVGAKHSGGDRYPTTHVVGCRKVASLSGLNSLVTDAICGHPTTAPLSASLSFWRQFRMMSALNKAKSAVVRRRFRWP